jgi:hypothetical protein
VSSQRCWEKVMVATPSVQPWLWHRNATILWATATAEQHSAHGQAAKHITAPREDAGVADAIQPARQRRHHRDTSQTYL